MSVSDFVIPRSDWNPQYQDGDLNVGKASKVSVHHSVTTQLPVNATRDQERAQMRTLESIGQSRFGTGISYNIVIFPSGRAYQGVSFHRRGTHTDGMNSTTRSICFAGNYEENEPTDAQIAKAATIYSEGEGDKWITNAPLFGHRDIKQTACPGRYVYARLNHIKNGFSNTPEDGFLMALTNEEQHAILHDAAQINEVVHRHEEVDIARREADLNYMSNSASRESNTLSKVNALVTTVNALTEQVNALHTKIDQLLAE